jgi:hypothetical protein
MKTDRQPSADPQENDEEWRIFGVCVEGAGPFPIDEINVWEHEWTRTGEKAPVTDPKHGQRFLFDVWEIATQEKRIRFVAGEFSNCVWGFYVRSEV